MSKLVKLPSIKKSMEWLAMRINFATSGDYATNYRIVQEDEGDFDRILLKINTGQFQIHLGHLVKDFEKECGFTLSWMERYGVKHQFWIRFVRRLTCKEASNK